MWAVQSLCALLRNRLRDEPMQTASRYSRIHIRGSRRTNLSVSAWGRLDWERMQVHCGVDWLFLRNVESQRSNQNYHTLDSDSPAQHPARDNTNSSGGKYLRSGCETVQRLQKEIWEWVILSFERQFIIPVEIPFRLYHLLLLSFDKCLRFFWLQRWLVFMAGLLLWLLLIIRLLTTQLLMMWG